MTKIQILKAELRLRGCLARRERILRHINKQKLLLAAVNHNCIKLAFQISAMEKSLASRATPEHTRKGFQAMREAAMNLD